MTDQLVRSDVTEAAMSEPLLVVSCDSHVGPTLDQMRDYCPAQHLDDYDAFSADFGGKFDIWADIRENLAQLEDKEEARIREHMLDRNLQTPGHTDMDARRRDMDADGVAVDVIFHSSQNGWPIPFVRGGSLFFNPTGGDLDRAALGFHIYNAWLADACATAPDRHLGVVHIPSWDIEAAVREVEWARSVGLRSVNLPSPRPGVPIYDHPDWEPFWSACEALEMPLNTHVGGAGGEIEIIGKHAPLMLMVERGGWLSRRGLHRMLFSGVFERHPGLKYILTEQNGEWWSAAMREYDSAYKTNYWQIKDQIPNKPSEYCARNVFVCGSYMAPFEAKMAVDDGYAANVVWGSDYPHAEGTYQYPDSPEDEGEATRLAQRYAFAEIPPENTKAILEDNAVRLFGLDAKALRPVVERINAPTLADLAVPVTDVPEWTGCMAFRTIGPWG